MDVLVGGAAVLVKRALRWQIGKCAGALVKLRECGFRTALPSIHLANLRSLPNKTDELLLLTCTNKDFSNSAALCFTETSLSEAIPDNALHLPGYQLFRSDCITELTGKTRGGGLCFCINEGWCSDVTTLKKMCSPNLEALFINCKPFYSPREFSSFILVNVYVPGLSFFLLSTFIYFFTHKTTQHPKYNKTKQQTHTQHLKVQSKGRERGKDNKNTKVTPPYNHVYQTKNTGRRPGPTDSCRCTFTSHYLQEATDPICFSTHVWCKPVLDYCLLRSCKTSKQHSLLH